MIFPEQIFALSCVAVIEKEANQRAYCVFCHNVLKVLFSLFLISQSCSLFSRWIFSTILTEMLAALRISKVTQEECFKGDYVHFDRQQLI